MGGFEDFLFQVWGFEDISLHSGDEGFLPM